MSSVLNNMKEEYGRKHLFDNKPETCWNSEPGLPQYILLTFKSPVQPEFIEIVGQGGFCPRVRFVSDFIRMQNSG